MEIMRIGGAMLVGVSLVPDKSQRYPEQRPEKPGGNPIGLKKVCNIGKMHDKICQETSTLFPCMQNTAKKTTKTSFIKQFRKNIEELQNKMIKFVEK